MPAEKDVVVVVGGDTSVLQREMKKGGKSVSSFSSVSRERLKEVATGLAKLTAAAIAAGSALTVSLTKKGLDAVDSQAKLAKAMQTSVASIQTLQRVADLEGIPSLIVNMEALTRRLSRAANGTGPAVKSLKQLNLTAEELLNIPADERLELIGKRMRELVDPTKRQAIAFDLFDASGAKIAETIASGAGVIRNARNEMKDFGVALKEVDAKRVEAANDAMSSFNVAIDAVSQNLAVEFAPVLTFIGTRFGELVKQNKGFKDSVRNAFDVGVQVVAVFADALDLVKIAFKGLEVVAAGFAAVFNNAISMALKPAVGQIKLFVKNVIITMNEMIETINKAPFVNFDKIGQPDMSFLDAIVDAGPASTQRLIELRDELDGMVNQFSVESSGEKIKSFMGMIVDEARKTSDEVREIFTGPGGFTPPQEMQLPGGSPEDIEAREAFAKELEARLETLKLHLATEEQVEIMSQQKRMEELDILKEQGVVNDEERRRLQEELEQKHQATLTEIRKKGLTDLEKFNSQSFAKQTSTVLGEMVNITQGVAQENKTLFEINKQAATGQAIVDGISAVMRTMSAYPFPLSIAMAGLQAAANVAQIAAIQSQTFGGSNTAPSLAGSTPAPPVTNVGAERPGQNVFIDLHGDSFSDDAVRKLIEKLNEATKNGARIVVT